MRPNMLMNDFWREIFNWEKMVAMEDQTGKLKFYLRVAHSLIQGDGLA